MPSWLPGPGDLYVTVFGGRTVALGKLLGSGMSFTQAPPKWPASRSNRSRSSRA
jgi:hypothetical protein